MMTPYECAARYLGVVHELAGAAQHPLIQWWLQLCGFGFDAADEVPWCSAFVNGMCWQAGYERSHSAAARSWLKVGRSVTAGALVAGDVIVLARGADPSQGHVGFYVSHTPDRSHVRVLGGNQGNGVSVAEFPVSAVLDYRRMEAHAV